MKSNSILCSKDLSLGFGDWTLFSDLSFTLCPGEILSIIGPNGGGKTGLLKYLARLPLKKGEWRRGSLISPSWPYGYLPQQEELNFFLPIRGKDILNMPQDLSSTPKAKAHSTSFTKEELISLLGLEKLLEEDFRCLSGGQKQRMMLARSLMVSSPLVLLDEPSKGLDRQAQDVLSELFYRVKKKGVQGLIVVEHNLSRARKGADAILALNQKESWYGPSDKLTQEHLNRIYGCVIDADL